MTAFHSLMSFAKNDKFRILQFYIENSPLKTGNMIIIYKRMQYATMQTTNYHCCGATLNENKLLNRFAATNEKPLFNDILLSMFFVWLFLCEMYEN